jgi:hypothetical protein
LRRFSRQAGSLQGIETLSRWPGSAQRFLSIHAAVYNAFYVQRHLLSRRIFKVFRTETLAVWNQSWLAI